MFKKTLVASTITLIPLGGVFAAMPSATGSTLPATPTVTVTSAPTVVKSLAATKVTKVVKPGVRLNVRTGPSTRYRTIGTVTGGTRLTGTVSGKWFKIASGKYTGRYVSNGYLLTVASAPKPVTPKPIVTNPVTPKPVVIPSVDPRYSTRWVNPTTTLNVRTGPSTSNKLVGTLAPKSVVSGTISNGWMKIAAGKMAGKYVYASYLTVAKPANVSTPYLKSTPEFQCKVATGDTLLKGWPARVRTRIAVESGLTNIGGTRPGDPQDHGQGLALDVMTPKLSDPRGDVVADWAKRNASALSVKYVIWKQHIWSPVRASEGWRKMENRGSNTQNHYDHVHISFNTTSGSCPL